MGEIIAMCGLICNDCLVYIATQKNDDNIRKRVVKTWSTETEHLTLNDIHCNGCQTEGKLYRFCSTCEVRKCNLERGVNICAYCAEYPCKKLEKLWQSFRTVSWKKAKTTLDSLRKLQKLA
jgi:hypothetical protein